MRLPEIAIKNNQFTVIVALLLVLSGIVSALNMPRYEDPVVDPPGSNIFILYPGASPKDLEEQVVDILEESINELEDIKHLFSFITDGLATIEVEFTAGSDGDDKYSDVLQKVNTVRNQLPDDIAYLDMIKWSISDVSILQLALVSEETSYRTLENESDELKKLLEKIPGVKRVEQYAIPEQEIRVSLDIEKIAARNISLNRIIGAIQGNSANIPGGYIDIGKKRFNIKTSGAYENLDEIKNTIIGSYDGNIVYLKDVANAEFTYEDKNYYARINDEKAVFITVTQKTGSNIFPIKADVERILNEFSEHLPENIRIETVFDQSISVSDRLDNFFINLMQGVALVGVIIIIALGFKASVLAMMAIPVSILIALGFVDLTGYGLQQMTITGMVIALGLLVDNVIVVTEIVARNIKKGMDHLEAAVKGTSVIGWAVVSATMTTVLAFLPIIMMQDVTGDFIRSMPVTVVYTLIASLMISLTLSPFLASKLLKRYGDDRGKKIRERAIDWLISRTYIPSLNYSLKHPKLIIALSVIVFAGSLSLVPLVGVSFFPKAEKPNLIINVNTPEGTSLDATNEIVEYVESVLRSRAEVKHYASNIGRGNPRIYYNIISEREKSTHSQIFVELHEYDPVATPVMIEELRKEFKLNPGARIEVKELEQGPPVNAPIEIRILGENLDTLKKLARDVEDIISGTNGTINVDNALRTTKTDLHVNINRDKAGILGIPVVDIDRTIRTAFAGITAAQFRDDEGKEYDVVVRLPYKDKLKIEDFSRIYIASVSGEHVPLNQLASIEFVTSPTNIEHYNLERTATITADAQRGYTVNDLTMEIIDKLENHDWPRGYRYYAAGELESREESFGGLAQAVIIAMFGILGVLVLQFRSISQPLIVFSAIPLAIIGSILMLLITGNTFSFMAFVGLTSLVGIVVNNSIILVDYANQLRRQGKGLIDSIMESAETRFLPIILTTATTIGGLLPLTLRGGTMWAPMGWTIIGGLMASTVLTLILVPVLYKVFSPRKVQ